MIGASFLIILFPGDVKILKNAKQKCAKNIYERIQISWAMGYYERNA